WQVIKPVEDKIGLEDVFAINLFHAKDWKARLLGRWVLRQNQLYFEEGLLITAIASKRPIEIQNGLWDDPEFSHFFNRARTLGKIQAYGEEFDVSNCTFVKSEGYDWALLKKVINFDRDLKQNAPVLNPGKLIDYFRIYHCDNATKQLNTLNGLIADNENT